MSAKNSKNSEKKEVIDQLLAEETMHIHLDASTKNVILPSHLKKDVNVTLKLSRYFTGLLELNEDSIETELSFNGNLFSCSIPYFAVWGAISFSGETTVWPESAPQDIVASLLISQAARSNRKPVVAAENQSENVELKSIQKKSAPHLKRIK